MKSEKRVFTRDERRFKYNRGIMHCVRVAFAAILSVFSLPAQAPDLQFEVASLKPSQPGAQGVVMHAAPGSRRYIVANENLKEMLVVAYRLRFDQVSGAAGWMATDRWDINAEAERPSSVEEFQVMLRNLLEERFKLQMHFETKERPVYVMLVDKAGMKMTPHEIGGGDRWIDQTGFLKWTARFIPMDYFAWLLSGRVGRPVIDRTGLKGTYDFTLAWSPGLPAPLPDADVDRSGPGLVEAVQKQLGLKLDPQRAPVDLLVIDHAEKPTEN
jgi:uncharacterized protein (TIGR03435 family)